MANIFYIDKDAFLRRFPPDSIKAVIDNFLAKEKVHTQKIQKLKQELQEECYENHQNKINFKTNSIFRYIQPASFAQIRKKIQSTQMKNSETEKNLFQKAFDPSSSSDLTALEFNQNDSKSGGDLLDMKSQLHTFLRNTIRKKPNKLKYFLK